MGVLWGVLRVLAGGWGVGFVWWFVTIGIMDAGWGIGGFDGGLGCSVGLLGIGSIL